jgi:tryptophan-rich sensory protein
VIVFVMLYVLALVSALLVGYDMARAQDRHRIHVLGFAAATAFAFYVVLDLEYPRLGLIRIYAFNQLLVDLLASMK